MQEQLVISSLDQLKAISDPLRLQLFEDIREANRQGKLQPIRQLAENLQTSHAKLYYHAKQLEKHGFIRVADIVFVSGIAEKHYEVIGEVIVVDQALLSTSPPLEEMAETVLIALRSAFDLALSDVSQFLQTDPSGEHTIHFDRQLLRLTNEEATTFRNKLKALEMEMAAASKANEGQRGEVYGLTAVFTPTLKHSLNQEDQT